MKLIIQKAVQQLIPQWEWLLEELQAYVVANPSTTKGSAAAHIAGLTSPFALATLQISDPVTALEWFISQTGATWAQVKQFLQNHPVKVIRNFDPEIGNVMGINPDDSKIMRIVRAVEQDDMNWGDIDWPTDVEYTEIRTAIPGPTFNFVSERQWVGTLDGEVVRVRQPISNVYDGTRVQVTPGNFEVV